MKSASILGLGLVALLAACDHKDDANSSADASSAVVSASAVAPVSASAAPSAAPTAVGARVVPSQADEAVLAAKEIDKTNYKKELDALEKDLK